MMRNIRLFIFILFSIFCLFPFFKGTGAEVLIDDKALSEEALPEKRNSLKNYPEFVRAISSKAKNAYKNQKGFWEAEFEDGIIMVYIPGGKFQQGSGNGRNNEGAMRSVYLDGYWIGKYEVTFDQYDQFCEEQGIIKPDDEGWGRERNPLINVSWFDAMAYCQWLSNKIGINFNLPTESQWEKAARGTDGRMYPWGNSLPTNNKANFTDRVTNFERHSSTANKKPNYTTPVGSYTEGSSTYGLLDMAGNVYEWCFGLYSSSNSSSSLRKNSQELKKDNNTYRVLRGGSWYGVSRCLKTTFRTAAKPTSRYFHIGFRLCAE